MIIERIARKSSSTLSNLLWRLRWGRKPFAEYQRQEMNRRSELDEREAVGGLWDEMGELQLAVLQEHGLTPESTLLDIGCGSLRGGLKIIPFLQPGHYWGTEISERLLDSGRQMLERKGLENRNPHLIHAADFSFRGLEGQKFSHMLLFGVFTDLPPSSVADAIAGLPALMTEGSTALATFGLSSDHTADYRNIRFRQPMGFFEELAGENNLKIELVAGFSHRHPKGHSMLRITLNGTP